jgi:hypothetical protein
MSTPTFENPQLQEAFNETSSQFDSGLWDLDKISSDIKALEKYLQDMGVWCEYTLDCGTHQYEAGKPCVHEALEWYKDKMSGKLRLLFCQNLETANGDGDATELDEKPLIQTPSEIRRRMAPHLPAFLRGIAQEMKKDIES